MLQLEVGPQRNYTTGLPPLPPRRIHQPLYFGKVPGNIIAAYFFMYLCSFFTFKTKIPFMHVFQCHSPSF